jgi:Sec-independent protein secretion pathway component TatC
VLTPTTDWINMSIVAGPMFALYVVGIGAAWMFGRERTSDASKLPEPAA